MRSTHLPGLVVDSRAMFSEYLRREVKLDFYLPPNRADHSVPGLLLINDGQHMQEMGLAAMLHELYAAGKVEPLLCVAIHAGPERKNEYGVSSQTDYEGRGAKAGAYTSFVIHELLPYINDTCKINSFKEKAFAGFSLGALMAFDIVFNHPAIFSKAGLFSGSFWWRSLDQHHKDYDDDRHRIMHQVIRKGRFHQGLKFFFQCGNMDEILDRNNNGIIDSIDDTQDIIRELVAKGYDMQKDIFYMEMPDGKHDIATWGKAMYVFLEWLAGNEA
jgi:enterochelin esterase-like enzyme